MRPVKYIHTTLRSFPFLHLIHKIFCILFLWDIFEVVVKRLCWSESSKSKLLDSESLERQHWGTETSLIFRHFLLVLLHPSFPLSLLFSSVSVHSSLLSSAFRWLTWSHSSRFIGSGGELGPFWRHFERYRVSSMFCVSLKSTTTTTDHDHPPRWLGFKFLMIMGGRAPWPSTPPSSPSSALSLLDMLFSLSWLCLSQMFHTVHDPVHSTKPPSHHKWGFQSEV